MSMVTTLNSPKYEKRTKAEESINVKIIDA